MFVFFFFCLFVLIRSFLQPWAVTRVQETPCAHFTTSVYIHLILICVPEDRNSPNSHLEIPDISDVALRALTCWVDDTQQTLLSCIFFIYIYTRRTPFSTEREARARNFTELSVHFSVKKKKKEEHLALDTLAVFLCAFFFFFEETTIVLPISNGF